jgi:hypothetical protein
LFIYEYVNERTQEREWRRATQLERVSDIYSPLYDQLADHERSLRNLWDLEFSVWATIENDHRGQQVDSAVRPHMESYYGALKEYMSSYTALLKRLPRWFEDTLQAILGSPSSSISWTQLAEPLLRGWQTLTHEDGAKSAYADKFRTAFRDVSREFPKGPQDPDDVLAEVRERLLSLHDLQELIAKRDRADKLRKQAKDVAGRVIRRPYILGV